MKIIILITFLSLFYSCSDNKIERFKDKSIVKSEMHYNMLELITSDGDTLVVVLKDKFTHDNYNGLRMFGGNGKFIYYMYDQHIYGIEYLDVVKSTLE